MPADMNQQTLQFIRDHAADDVRQLALRGCSQQGVDMPFALNQIAGRRTALRKLPLWAATDGIVYPPHLSMEQCSSQATSEYKSLVARRWLAAMHIKSGGTVMTDLTGGFGVDFSFMAPCFSRAVYVECQPHLCDMARTNFRLLGLDGAEVVCADSMAYLREMPPAALVYLDPARRDGHGGRTYAISDCTPDILSLLPLLLQKGRVVMVKLSPMLDWRQVALSLGGSVREIHIVSVGNECKELLVVMTAEELSGHVLQPLQWGTLTLSGQAVDWVRIPVPGIEDPLVKSSLSSSPVCQSSSVCYLYEPNASLMKAGCFRRLSAVYPVRQVAANSHLFLSSEVIEGFPGRRFEILSQTSLNRKELKVALRGVVQANIAVRNFPMTVAQLRQRLKIGDGGDIYLFATTLATGERSLYVCRKL